jgi:hypothetical protein
VSFAVTPYHEGSALRNRFLSGLRRLAVAVPFFVLAMLLLAFLAGPVKRGAKAGGNAAPAQAGAAVDPSGR